MLFVTFGTAKSGTMRERLSRRLQWSYPEGSKIVGEYWLQTADPTLVVISEAESVAPIMAATAAWDDLMSFATFPAVSAEQGLDMARTMS